MVLECNVWLLILSLWAILLTHKLYSFLANTSDTSLILAARTSEEAKVGIRNQGVEWFEEDNNIEFNEEFSSEFASSLSHLGGNLCLDNKTIRQQNSIIG